MNPAGNDFCFCLIELSRFRFIVRGRSQDRCRGSKGTDLYWRDLATQRPTVVPEDDAKSILKCFSNVSESGVAQ